MPLLVLLRLGVRSLKLHKLRSSLSILGVVFGVAAVVAMSSVGEGARRETLAQIASLGIDTVTLRPRPPEPGEKTPAALPAAAAESLGAGRARRARGGAAARRRAAGGGGRPQRRRDRDRHDRRPIATRRGSSSPRAASSPTLDVADRKRVAVLGAAVARALFPLGSPLGESVRLGGDWYQVVGVLEGRASPRGRGAAIRGRDLNRSVLVPLQALDRGADRAAGRRRRDRLPRRDARGRRAGGRRRAGARAARDRRGAARGDRAARDPAPARAHPARLQRGDRRRGGDQPARGRDRDHEHHAGERRRAHARGGRPPRPRRPPAGRGRAVPRRELAPHRHRRASSAASSASSARPSSRPSRAGPPRSTR